MVLVRINRWQKVEKNSGAQETENVLSQTLHDDDATKNYESPDMARNKNETECCSRAVGVTTQKKDARNSISAREHMGRPDGDRPRRQH